MREKFAQKTGRFRRVCTPDTAQGRGKSFPQFGRVRNENKRNSTGWKRGAPTSAARTSEPKFAESCDQGKTLRELKWKNPEISERDLAPGENSSKEVFSYQQRPVLTEDLVEGVKFCEKRRPVNSPGPGDYHLRLRIHVERTLNTTEIAGDA